MKTLLLDADFWIYMAAAGAEYETQWDSWMWTLHADLDQAIATLEDSITRIIEVGGTDNIVLALTDDHNFRKDVLPTYKAHRLNTRKPVCYKAMREYVAEKYQTYQRPGLEGDDVLGILGTGLVIKGEKIIVSVDKDMLTVPGQHLRYDVKTGEFTPLTVSVQEADRFHLYQTLTGDSTDGYSGCPGIGPVKAEKILEPFFFAGEPRWKDATNRNWPGKPASFDGKGAWSAVVAAYEKAGLSEVVALQQARVARICRANDYNFSERRVKLWKP